MARIRRALGAAAVAASLVSCTATKAAPVAEDPVAAQKRRDVLVSAGDAVGELYAQFAVDARALREASATWSGSGAEGDRDAAREAWRTAMTTWEKAELFRFGPAGPMGSTVGGLDLRDAIYSWPTRNACRIDQEIVAQSYADAAAFAALAVNVRGLDAIEYLLFWTDAANQCDPARTINADGSWLALDEIELQTRRGLYAVAAADDLVKSADALVTAWADFAMQLADAGNAGSPYPTSREALNQLFDAIFYVESDVKDMKLGEPAGIVNCAMATCPDQREFLWADFSFPAIRANLDGFELGYRGGDGPGFDVLLRDLGQDALADDIDSKLAAAQAATAPEVSMVAALSGDIGPVVGAHAALKELTDLLKTQFISVLDLELPDRAEGDND